MAKSLNADVEKCVERLQARFPQFEEYKLDFELPANKGKYVAVKIQNENPVSFSIYALISQADGVLLRFGDMILFSHKPEVNNEMLDKIELILSDRFIALINYESVIYEKQGIPNFTSHFVMNETGEYDDERKRLRDTLIEVKRHRKGLGWLFNKYKGITVIVNWSGSTFEKYEN